MKIGVPKEIISQEYRVGINPITAQLLIENSHEVFVENNAGIHSGYSNSDYQQVGCTILDKAVDVFDAVKTFKDRRCLMPDLRVMVSDPTHGGEEEIPRGLLATLLGWSRSHGGLQGAHLSTSRFGCFRMRIIRAWTGSVECQRRKPTLYRLEA